MSARAVGEGHRSSIVFVGGLLGPGPAQTATLALDPPTGYSGEGERHSAVIDRERFRREAAVGAINGVVFAIVMAGVGWIFFGSWTLGAVIGAALIINLIVAALAGVLVPLALDRFDLDPALASGTFVTTMTDVVGFFAFLGLATLVLL